VVAAQIMANVLSGLTRFHECVDLGGNLVNRHGKGKFLDELAIRSEQNHAGRVVLYAVVDVRNLSGK
jgi:hypothetical protein